MKDVIISIKGLIGPEVADSEDLEFVTDGHYSYENGTARFDYMESELTGMDGTRTEFCSGPDGITLSRNGTVSTCMRFRQGEKQYCLYDTPFGSAMLGIDTHRINSDLRENGGSLEFKYAVDMEGTLLSRNHIKIKIRERSYRI